MILLEGRGLHSGAPCSVAFAHGEGPPSFASEGGAVPWDQLRVVDTARSTTVALGAGGARVRTVEHLFAALGALGVATAIAVDVRGGEVPILDGGAARFCAALSDAVPSRSVARPRLRVVRDAVVTWRGTEWTLSRRDDVRVAVRFESALPHLDPEASWSGSPEDFIERIAPARTFAMADDLELLVREGLARATPPESVVVYGIEGALFAGEPPAPDEAARHKLLDLVGDLTLRGGLVLGDLVARRPGHASTHALVERCVREGILAPI